MKTQQVAIESLIEEYLQLNDSSENQRRLACWEPEICARDQWHGRAIEGAFKRDGQVSITIDIQHPLWLQFFPQDLSHTFTDPEAYLRFYLQKRITQFKEFQDDTPLEPLIPIWMHTPFEMSLFGMPYHYYEDKDPLIDLDSPVCYTPEALDDIGELDFSSAGMMPSAHRLYEGINEIVGYSFKVLFPEWIRGPFGVALHIAGYQNVLIAMVANPEFLHALMARINKERMRYFQYRTQFSDDKTIPPGSLFNDEVDAGIIGPQHYREFIRPYEEELGIFHDRISYWHSCGNTALFAEELGTFDRIDVLDVSGFTNLEQVVANIGFQAPRLDIRLHPLEDLQNASIEKMESKIKTTIELCRRYDIQSMSIRVSGLNPWKSPDEDFNQIRQWISVARKVIESY